jgi:hypothetical protein
MEFNRPLRPPKPCPVKNAQAQINRGGIQTDQFVLKPKLLSFSDLHSAAFEKLEKNLLIQFPGPMSIGIGQRGAIGGSDSQMPQFPFTASKASDNLPEGMGSAQLAEEHGHKLTPAGKSSGMSFGLSLFHGLLELDSRKQL